MSGLGENSRIARKESEMTASTEALILAHIADRLGAIISILSGCEIPASIFDVMTTKKDNKKSEYISYSSAEEFMRERYR